MQRPAQTLSGDRPWTQRTEVLLAWRDRAAGPDPGRAPGAVTEVSAAAGLPAPDYVLANAGDYGYFLFLLDSASARARGRSARAGGRRPAARDAVGRAVGPGARVAHGARALRRLALRELPGSATSRSARGPGAARPRGPRYLRPTRGRGSRRRGAGAAERRAGPALPYGMRKAYADAFIGLRGLGRGPRGPRLLAADSFAGEPVSSRRAGHRRAAAGARRARRRARLAAEAARDTTPEAAAASSSPAPAAPTRRRRRTYLRRYLADSTLNEEWVTASLGAFNALEHAALTLPYLRPALDSLPLIQANRRIFFLESWLAAFLRGQTGDSALATVRRYLDDHPRLPEDIRRKVLQHMDELERTVRIRGWTPQ